MDRFKYKIYDDKQIEIEVWGRKDLKDADGKYIDTFTTKSFLIESKELLEIQKLMTQIIFDWCNKFKCKIDAPACH